MTEATTHIPAPPDELNPRQAAFCEAYVSGPTSGNGTASYRAAGYKPQRDNAAATAASRLLRDVHVIEYIGALRRAAAANVVDNLSSWAEAEPAARAIVIQIAKGEIPADPRVRVKAAQYIADRALGKPKQAVEVDGHISSADQAIKALSEELAEYDRRIAEEDATNGNGTGVVGPIDAKSEPRGRRRPQPAAPPTPTPDSGDERTARKVARIKRIAEPLHKVKEPRRRLARKSDLRRKRDERAD